MVHHFEMGIWLLFLAYLTSVVGATIGLACTLQSRQAATTTVRVAWLVLAALSIGGVGIWLMHFIAMLGFDTPGMPVRYDVTRTLLSAVLAVGAVFGGLLVLGVQKRFALWRLLVAGAVTGLAVSLMHYTGMWAVNVRGTIGYNPFLVALSVLIAVGAATAALWCAVAVDRASTRLLAGAVLGVAATGMHYTGMAAVRADLDPSAPDPAGVEVFSFLFPVFILAAAALALPIVALLTTSHTDDEDAVAAPVARPQLDKTPVG
jgi:NO-binding membrane sensor protein with MHYT domain